jgi:hypothetical protein
MNKRPHRELSTVYDYIIANKLTMVTPDCFVTIDKMLSRSDTADIEGDIIECGCWRGGMSLYLSFAFPDRRIWVCDSFAGFEPIEARRRTGTHNDHHHATGLPSVNQPQLGGWVSLTAPYDEVKGHFEHHGLTEDCGVHIVKGYVQDSLYTPPIQDIQKIFILRVDVDAYSATYDVLEALFDKVVPGGYIIFDDSGIPCAREAIVTFSAEKEIDITSKLLDASLTPANGHIANGQVYRKEI